MENKKEEIKEFLKENSGYLKWSAERLALRFNDYSLFDILTAMSEIKTESKNVVISKDEYDAFMAFKAFKQELSTVEGSSRIKGLTPYDGDVNNVLVVGDLHCPFDLDSYLLFCREQQEIFDCGTVIFIGDLIDGCSYNFHEKNPDGLSQRDEIESAQDRLNDWYKVFPKAKVTLGNHDLLIARKLKYVGLSNMFMKDFRDIWKMPKEWEVGHEFLINDVKYTHGDKGNAIAVAKDSRTSSVQGHMHTQGFVEYAVSEKDRIFGMQVGCGIDHKAYAFEYSKGFAKKPFIGCGVVLNDGKLPIVIPMEL